MKTRVFGLVGMVLVVAVSLFGSAATGSSASNRGDVGPNISITTLPTTITQDFNTLLSSGSATWTNNSTLTGWYHARTGTGTTIVANDGSSNAGNFYSYGTGTNIERALGSLGSGNAAVGNLFWGILLTNNTGSTITTLDVSYTGEQWRNSAAAAQTVSFSYLVGTGLTGNLVEFQSAGTPVASLDFTSPITGGAAAALDGNLAANRIAITFSITGLSVAPGQDIMLRWSDPDHTGADHGLSVDDFSVTASSTGGPTPTPSPTATGTPSATPAPTRIRDIQGATHRSPLDAQVVAGVPGIVTAKVSNGFYLQDPSPDANNATSEGIFVFTSSAPTVNVGDAILVGGTVVEFRPGGSSTTNLTTTEISAPGLSVAVQSTGNPLPPPIVVGTGGRIPPMTVIDDDATGSVETSGTFDHTTDGIDFYESLEGMRVQINGAVAVGPRTDFGEIPVLSDDGANAVVRTARGGVVVRSTDFNPERVFLDDAIQAMPVVNVGDHFSAAVVGVLDYNFGNFKLQITQSLTAVSGGLTRETTALPTATQLAIATFNVENLDPGDPPAQFSALASLIVNNLRSPDILTLEEVQDNNGPTNDVVVDATTTYNTLIAAIQAAGGPTYSFRQVNPVDDQDGGEPGGNIRVGFLFRTDRGLAFVDRAGGCSTCPTTVSSGGSGVQLSFSPGRVDPTNAAFNSSRKPLAGEFTFNGQKLFLIANHFNSKGGDDPLFGRFQPPVLSSETQRNQQAQIVNNFVDSILALDSSAKIVVLGDLNDFHFSTPINTLKGGVLHALIETLPQSERYTYVFEGNSQDLDHILVSDSLFSGLFEYDVVHVNSEFADQISDHDPQVVRLPLGASPTPTATPTVTATATVAPTATATATATVAPTATATVAPTATATATVAPTATATATATVAPSATASPTCPPQLTEGFESVAAIFNTGWAENNNSEPLGASTWVQGAPGSGLGAAQGGTTNSFIVVNFNSTIGTGTISNWLFTPVLNLQDGATLTFWTRGPTGSTFPDRLQVRMSLAGASVNVGTTSTDVGVFTALLVDINPTLTVGGYPQVWTQFTATVTGVPGQQLGRMAFRYFVTNAGPSGANSDIIGIDTVAFNGPCGPTPTPGTPTPTATPTATATATPTATATVPPTATPSPSEAPPSPTPPVTPNPCAGTEFMNSTFIGIPATGTGATTGAPANPYPSNIVVAGLSGTVTKVSVRLGVNHTFPDDLDVLLVGPGGQTALLMSDVGGDADTMSTVILTFDDAAAASLPDGNGLVEGTFKPTNIGGADAFPAPAPAPGDNTLLSIFNGTAPNGTWALYVVDDKESDLGSFSAGWSLTITTVAGCGTPFPSPTVTPSPSATPSPSPITKAINLSTRMRVQTGDNVGIGGFIITGTTPKNVIIRAIGPTLADVGVPDALADPVLELHGPDSFATIINNDWRDEQEAEIQATGIPPTDNFESAIVATLAPETYTAIVRGNGNSSGVALVEVYDLNQGVDSKLANLSTRAFVSTNDNIVIAGFLLSDNNVNDRIIVRGIGPSLAPAIFPASAVLADPTLELRDNNGTLILSNNDWQDNAAQAAEISAAGLAPSNDLESAIAATLPPGLYTALLAGLNNGTGIGVVEIYDRGP